MTSPATPIPAPTTVSHAAMMPESPTTALPTAAKPGASGGRAGATPAAVAAWLSVIFSGAIFGFFYAWVCSTMWGLDALDPRVAIEAMNAMNASVRNPVFMPAFFLTPVVLAVAAILALGEGRRVSAGLLGSAALLYAAGGLLLTATVNVPMNEALAQVSIPADEASAREIWLAYSTRWQTSNLVRTVVSGVSLGLAALALIALPRVRIR